MKKGLTGVALCLGIFCSTMVFASPINLPEGIKGEEGLGLTNNITKDVSLSAAYLYDHVAKRELSDDSGDLNYDMMGGKINVTLMNRFDIYTILGSSQSAELDAGGNNLVSFEDNFMWGLGASAIIYKHEETGIQLFGDANYRQASGIGIDSVTLSGVKYSKSQLSGLTADCKLQEWQAALGISKKFKYVAPYVGIKYSDVKVSGSVTAGGTTLDLGSAKSQNKVGPFVGISITPIKGISIDVSGRFVDEEAVSVSTTVRF